MIKEDASCSSLTLHRHVHWHTHHRVHCACAHLGTAPCEYVNTPSCAQAHTHFSRTTPSHSSKVPGIGKNFSYGYFQAPGHFYLPVYLLFNWYHHSLHPGLSNKKARAPPSVTLFLLHTNKCSIKCFEVELIVWELIHNGTDLETCWNKKKCQGYLLKTWAMHLPSPFWVPFSQTQHVADILKIFRETLSLYCTCTDFSPLVIPWNWIIAICLSFALCGIISMFTCLQLFMWLAWCAQVSSKHCLSTKENQVSSDTGYPWEALKHIPCGHGGTALHVTVLLFMQKLFPGSKYRVCLAMYYTQVTQCVEICRPSVL